MRDTQHITVEEGTIITDAIKKMDEAGEKVILVTKNNRLTGIVTDGDIRRWILRKKSLNINVNYLMNREPRFVFEGEEKKAKDIIKRNGLEAVPIVDVNYAVKGIVLWREIIGLSNRKYQKIDTPVVIMAGGKGTRLAPYTNILPKPLIPIGTTTILERIIDSFQKNGCKTFWLTVNYKKNLIKAYLDDKRVDYDIDYIEEEDFWGTCGSISLLKDKLHETFFVSNCDVVLDIDYSELLQYHKKYKNEITIVTSLKNIQIPYGVIELGKEGAISQISEKPAFQYNVNTGIYVMEPSVMPDIPEHQIFHMPDLLKKLMDAGRKVGAYPIREQQWSDMGEINEMREMVKKYTENQGEN